MPAMSHTSLSWIWTACSPSMLRRQSSAFQNSLSSVQPLLGSSLQLLFCSNSNFQPSCFLIESPRARLCFISDITHIQQALWSTWKQTQNALLLGPSLLPGPSTCTRMTTLAIYCFTELISHCDLMKPDVRLFLLKELPGLPICSREK